MPSLWVVRTGVPAKYPSFNLHRDPTSVPGGWSSMPVRLGSGPVTANRGSHYDAAKLGDASTVERTPPCHAWVRVAVQDAGNLRGEVERCRVLDTRSRSWTEYSKTPSARDGGSIGARSTSNCGARARPSTSRLCIWPRPAHTTNVTCAATYAAGPAGRMTHREVPGDDRIAGHGLPGRPRQPDRPAGRCSLRASRCHRSRSWWQSPRRTSGRHDGCRRRRSRRCHCKESVRCSGRDPRRRGSHAWLGALHSRGLRAGTDASERLSYSPHLEPTLRTRSPASVARIGEWRTAEPLRGHCSPTGLPVVLGCVGMRMFTAAAVAIAAWMLALAAVALLPVAPLFGTGWDYFYLVDVVNAVVYGALAWLLLRRHGGLVAWCAALVALGCGMSAFAVRYTQLDLPGRAVAEALQGAGWMPGTFLLMAVVPWLVRWDSLPRRARLVAAVAGAFAVVIPVLVLFDRLLFAEDPPPVWAVAGLVFFAGQAVIGLVGLWAAADAALRWR